MSTIGARADTLEVRATVPAPLPTAPAIITDPTDQQHVTTPVITVSGTCPGDSAYVRLDRNNSFSGVGQCVSGEFHIQTSLSPGANLLQARVFNFTDNEGPVSPPITVYYDPITPQPNPPQAPSPAPGTPSPRAPVTPRPSPPGQAPLQVIADYQYQTHFVGIAFEWPITVGGGGPPYTIFIDWKDGETTQFTSADGKNIILKHTYRTGGIFEPIVKVTDQHGGTVLLQLLAVAKKLPQFGANATFLNSISQYLWLMWPAYIIITLMVLSFWLGELEISRRQPNSRRTRA